MLKLGTERDAINAEHLEAERELAAAYRTATAAEIAVHHAGCTVGLADDRRHRDRLRQILLQYRVASAANLANRDERLRVLDGEAVETAPGEAP